VATDVTTPEQTLAWEAQRRTPAAVATALAGILTLAGQIYLQTQVTSDFPTVGADVDAATREETLAWEAPRRTPAAVASALAGVLTLGGQIYLQTQVTSDFPTVGVVQALTPALEGRVDAPVNPGTAGIECLNSKAGAIIATSVVTSIGTLLAGFAVLYLWQAARARRPETPTFARWTTIGGAIAVALMSVILQVIVAINASSFVDGTDRSRDAVEAVHRDGGLVVVQSIALAGQLAFAFSFVIVSLNAMRAGLLSRFMGVLGIIVGVLFIIPLGSPLPVVQCFWLLALAPLFLGKWPNGNPPAWEAGEARPWPTQQEIREARMRAKGIEPPARAEPAPDPEPEVVEDDAAEPTPAPQSSAARKRRKRRR
jgi:hypothetical protein